MGWEPPWVERRARAMRVQWKRGRMRLREHHDGMEGLDSVGRENPANRNRAPGGEVNVARTAHLVECKEPGREGFVLWIRCGGSRCKALQVSQLRDGLRG